MSGLGKEPPRGPRALLQSQSPGAGPSTAPGAGSKRPLPTGPRSLAVNGSAKPPPAKARAPPTEPSADRLAKHKTDLSDVSSRPAIKIPMFSSSLRRSQAPVRNPNPFQPPPKPPSDPPPPPPPPSEPPPAAGTPPPPPSPPPLPPSEPPLPPSEPPSVPLPPASPLVIKFNASSSSSKILPISSPFASAPPPPPPPPPAASPSPEPVKSISLPDWPPSKSELSSFKPFAIVYDPVVDKAKAADPTGYWPKLIDHVKKHAPPPVAKARVQGKPGKEVLFRYNGETLEVEGEGGFSERPPDESDPRRRPDAKTRAPRQNFHSVKYEHDSNSTGPPPPTSVLITNIPPLTPNHVIKRHFSNYGQIASFESQIDRERGNALGIVLIDFGSHEAAKKCAERENGRRVQLTTGTLVVVQPTAANSTQLKTAHELHVVLDGDGLKLKAVLKEYNDRKRKEKEQQKKSETSAPPVLHWKPGSTVPSFTKEASSTPSTRTPSSSTPQRLPNGLPPKPVISNAPAPSPLPPRANGLPAKPSIPTAPRSHQPDSSLFRAKKIARQLDASIIGKDTEDSSHHPSSSRSQQSSVPSLPRKPVAADTYRFSRVDHYSPTYRSRDRSLSSSRSPSPRRYRDDRSDRMAVSMRSSGQTKQRDADKEKEERDGVVLELAKNGMDHVRIDGGAQMSNLFKEEDVRSYFEEFKVDQILRDHTGWYITFQAPNVANRAYMVLNSGSRRLGSHTVSVSVHSAPARPQAKAESKKWLDDEDGLVAEAQEIICTELRVQFQKDILERVIGADLKRMVKVAKEKGIGASLGPVKTIDEPKTSLVSGASVLKSLTFKRKPKPQPEPQQLATPVPSVDEPKDLEEAEDRPKKKRKVDKKKSSKKVTIDVESEDEETPSPAVTSTSRTKRPLTPEVDEAEMPATKKRKGDSETKKKSAVAKKKTQKDVVDSVAKNNVAIKSPEVIQSIITPPKSPSPPPPPPLPFDDDEDEYFAKLVLSGTRADHDSVDEPDSEDDETPTFRKHVTGSARTEGFYAITHAEKAAYVAQYQARTTATEEPKNEAPQPQQAITSSRSNRANARRQAQGLEEINAVQRAMALSKGETPSAASELTFKFNQLQTRKKHLRFARSPIHDWGLYAMEKISKGEMVIEYVGEIIRAQVAEKREKAYERQGIGSSYLFRIDEDLVVDATKKGNLGRLINHSCDPNCTAKIITINSEKKIVIYAKQEIELGDEITYDYHFPFEQDKIPCLCGSAKCRGFLN